MRVLRVYHGGRIEAHRERERALVAAGVDVTLVAPSDWPEATNDDTGADPFRTIELPVKRPGDVNRHAYESRDAIRALIGEVRPDVLDLHEEPFSVAARQWLRVAPKELPVVMYTAQNVDKRFPPPFAQYERAAFRRVTALYPCSRQAASVARGKGFAGELDVLPLGFDETVFFPGEQSLEDELVIALFGRLVPEKGLSDAVRVLALLNELRPTRLVVAGSGPDEAAGRALAASLGVSDSLEIEPWLALGELATTYRRAQVVLIPSRPTETWVEQFGRVIVEAQASGAVVAGYSSGSIPEVAGDPAILTAVGGWADLGDRIARLAADPAEFAARRAAGIELSRERTWSDVAERQTALYER
ncbi:MAG: glycosyltransferase family 4 protein, partial [Actinobacteria bacterium]|nr:glycosyltransferase family 4 protein [Actinomycetota bacterium]